MLSTVTDLRPVVLVSCKGVRRRRSADPVCLCVCVPQRSLYLLEGGRLTRLDPVELRRRESVSLPAVQSGSRWFSDGVRLCSMAPQQDVSAPRADRPGQAAGC